MSFENVFYRTLPGAFAAREASMHQETDEEKKSFVKGFLQGVQYANPDPNVLKCPYCESPFVHMYGHNPIKLNDKLNKAGKQYDDQLEGSFHCRSCENPFPVTLKISVA